jgi:hypothetical protein
VTLARNWTRPRYSNSYRTVNRLLFALLVVASQLALAAGYLASTGQGTSAEIATQATLDPDEQAAVVPPREGITVVTTDSNVLADDRGYGPGGAAPTRGLGPPRHQRFVQQ